MKNLLRESFEEKLKVNASALKGIKLRLTFTQKAVFFKILDVIYWIKIYNKSSLLEKFTPRSAGADARKKSKATSKVIKMYFGNRILFIDSIF